MRQSMPSSSIDSCAGVSDTLPLVAKEREAYARREARLAKQEGGR